jgi:diguanylate cyclase (GGDEF)-like protein
MKGAGARSLTGLRLMCLGAAALSLAGAGAAPQQRSCALIDAEAISATNMADVDANAGLVKAESLISDARSAGCRMAAVTAQVARGDNLLTLGRYRDARDTYEGLIRSLTPAGPGVLLAGVLRRAGAAYYYTGELDRALERYRGSIAVAEKVGDRMDMAKAQGNIGALYVKIGWLDEALQIQERALANFEAVKWKVGVAGTTINLSHVHGELGDRAAGNGDSAGARTHYQAMYDVSQRAYTQFQALGNPRGIAISSANVAIAATDLGRYAEALDWHQRALALRRQIGDVQGQVNSLGTMAVALIGLRRLSEAQARLREADTLLTGLAASDRKLVEQSWVQLYRARGDYARALEHTSALLRLSQEIAAADYGTRVKELEARAEAERMDSQLGRERLWLILAVSVATLLVALFLVLLRAFQNSRRAARDLAHAVRTDPLTGLTNRVGVYERIEYERLRSDRSKQPFSLAVIDVDNFKAINDEHGHEVGDTVLAEVAHRIAAQLRAQDTAARWGGEEFLLLLPETGAPGGGVIARKVCEAVSQTPFGSNGTSMRMTLSIGVCEYRTGLTIDQCIKYADQAMYAGKQAGKNRVVVFGGQSGACQP